MSKSLNLEHLHLFAATLIAASPQILVTCIFAVWWLSNSYYQEWTFHFVVFIGYYLFVVASVWVCCTVVCVKKGRPRLSAYMIPATSVAAAMSLAGMSISFIAPGLETFILLILAASLLLLGTEVVGEALVRRRRATRKMHKAT